MVPGLRLGGKKRSAVAANPDGGSDVKLASSGEQNRGRCVDSVVLRGALHASLLQHCFEEADRPCSELMDAIVDEAMQRCAEGYGERLEKGLAVVCIIIYIYIYMLQWPVFPRFLMLTFEQHLWSHSDISRWLQSSADSNILFISVNYHLGMPWGQSHKCHLMCPSHGP